MKLSNAYKGILIVVLAVAALVVTIRVALTIPRPELGEDEGFIYYGPATVTVRADGATAEALERAREAFGEVGYFAAYAEGPDGRTGIWTGAHGADRARAYALALCGEGCDIVAERRPAAAEEDSPRVLTPELASSLKVRLLRGDYVAKGGANAWGAAVETGRLGHHLARRRALEECNARLAEEETPKGVDRAPCEARVYLGIHDRRPTPELYPADFKLDLADLVPAEFVIERRAVNRGRHLGSFIEVINPNGLHGAAAISPDGARGRVRSAGWPEAVEALALLACDRDRVFGDAPCVVSKSAVPDREVPDRVLAVSSALFEAFRAWEDTSGAGAFAISPFGAWGSSQGLHDTADAIQAAADWCLYYGRRSRAEFDFDNKYIEVDIPCRIVAIRDAGGHGG